jgi:hypothetical protein
VARGPVANEVLRPFERLAAAERRGWKVGLLSDFTRIPYANGAVFQTRALYQELNRCGHEVTLVGPRDPKAVPGDVPAGSIELPSLPLRTYDGVHLPMPLDRSVLDASRYDFDICYAQTTTMLLELGVWLRQMRGVPLLCVNTTHLVAAYDVLLPERLSKVGAVHKVLQGAFKRPLEKLFVDLYNRSDGLVVLSEGLRDYWRSLGVRVPVHVIGRTVTPQTFDRPLGPDPFARVLAERGLPAGGPRLLSAGRNTREKKQDRLIRIFAKHVAPAHPTATLFFVGDGPDTASYKALARRLGVEQRVVFVGEVSYQTMPDFYRHADLFLHVSLSETFGNVLGEALWCGAPAVAFADGMGASSQVADGVNGRLVPPSGPLRGEAEGDEAFGAAVLSLLADEARRATLSAGAVRRARELHSPHVIEQKLVDAFLSAREHARASGLRPLVEGSKFGQWRETARCFRSWAGYQGGIYLSGYLRPRAARHAGKSRQPRFVEPSHEALGPRAAGATGYSIRPMLRRFIVALVDASGRRPWTVLVATLALLAACWGYASRLELRTELRELLPRDSPGFQAYERQAGRIEGGATLYVVAESPSREQNERFVDELTAALEGERAKRAACRAACVDASCRAACGPDLIRYIEAGSKDLQAYFARTKWLYASVADLEAADEAIEREVGLRSGLVVDLESDGDGGDDGAGAPTAGPGSGGDEGGGKGGGRKGGGLNPDLRAQLDKLERRPAGFDEFPSGYFETPDGTTVAVRVVARTAELGDKSAARLLDEVRAAVERLDPKRFHPAMEVGYGGDIPSAITEQKSIASEALWATLLALTLVLGGVVFFYRSLWSLAIIALPAAVGVGAGYAFATAAFGYVNTVGAFLGAIVLGNGINYPIILLSRYRDFRARGMPSDEARRQAVLNAFRAELVGACVASIAYGSLTITRFRGFSQFGLIGFVGMLAVWAAIVPLVPALVVLVERAQARLPAWARERPPAITEDGATGPAVSALAAFVRRAAVPICVGAAAVGLLAAYRLPAFLRDPWEYNFARLGSRSSKQTGAGVWTQKATQVFGGRMNVAGAMMLADRPDQVPLLKARILADDAADPRGSLVAGVATVDDLLPGPAAEQAQKLELLARIRDRLTPRVLARLPAADRPRVEAARPPESVKPVGPDDLPPLLRRRFEEGNGRVGAVFFVKFRNDVSFSDGRVLLRMARLTSNVPLPDGTTVTTASRSTVFAEMIRSMERDGPLATLASLLAVTLVVIVATGSPLGTLAVVGSLTLGVLLMVGAMAHFDVKLNFLNFIALPITFGIGCEYPFNLFDRTRLLGGDVDAAVRRSAGPVALCSYTTALGYGSLAFADNQALQSFGKVAAFGEVACTFAALVVLPAALHLMSRSPRLRAGLLRGLVLRGPSSTRGGGPPSLRGPASARGPSSTP